MALTQAVDLAAAGPGAHRRRRARRPRPSRPSPRSPARATRSPRHCPPSTWQRPAQALDAAGWVVGADGIRAKDGQPLSVTFLHDTSAGRRRPGRRRAGHAAVDGAGRHGRGQGADRRRRPRRRSSAPATGTSPGSPSTSAARTSSCPSSPDRAWPPVAPTSRASPTPTTTRASRRLPRCRARRAARPGSTPKSHLVTAADVVPFANTVVKTFGNGAEFAISGSLIPTSIRMVAR